MPLGDPVPPERAQGPAGGARDAGAAAATGLHGLCASRALAADVDVPNVAGAAAADAVAAAGARDIAPEGAPAADAVDVPHVAEDDVPHGAGFDAADLRLSDQPARRAAERVDVSHGADARARARPEAAGPHDRRGFQCRVRGRERRGLRHQRRGGRDERPGSETGRRLLTEEHIVRDMSMLCD